MPTYTPVLGRLFSPVTTTLLASPSLHLVSPHDASLDQVVIDRTALTASTSSSSSASSGLSCRTCLIASFTSLEEQRAHCKTDWHRYNAQRRTRQQPPVNEAMFDSMAQQDDAKSMSGGSSAEDSDDEDDEDEEEEEGERGVAASSPFFVFSVTREGGGGGNGGGGVSAPLYLGVYKTVLLADREDATSQGLVSTLRSLSMTRSSPSSSSIIPGQWCVILARGGHFSAAIFDLAVKPPSSSSKTPTSTSTSTPTPSSTPLAPPSCLHHKSFHRYVIRAKQGGRQASKDATGKVAKSAGSALRRYNEVALRNDMEQLMTTWKSMLDACELIFVQVSKADRPALFDSGSGVDAPVVKAQVEGRVRRVPFATGRPTQREVVRVVSQLASVFDVTAAVEEERRRKEGVEAAAAAKMAARAATKTGGGGGGGRDGRATQSTPPSSPLLTEEMLRLNIQGQEVTLRNQDDHDETQSLEPPPLAGSTEPLHRAAKSGDVDRVTSLLVAGHDPTHRDEKGKVPYDLAKDKGVRDAFRRHMALFPAAFDWAAAHVPSPLTPEMESKQKAKEDKLEEKKRMEEKVREEEARKKMEEEERELNLLLAELKDKEKKGANKATVRSPPTTTPAARKGGPAAKMQAPSAVDRREAMAAAAEARMKALQAAAAKQTLY